MMTDISAETDLSDDVPENSDFVGAQRLADRINEFWRQRGVQANARLKRLPFHPTMREAFYAIETDLRDGLPPPPPQRSTRR